ncbi:NAD(P)H-binding protein [Actinoplanes sp. NPDC024001]|uniref:NAD(P)-dependent oxidoreductase n=1 Tax=Actinoplanes sp. NPDC024001 TaxID=3154598 RepID=UPI0033D45F06
MLVIGATGGTGQEVIRQALARGRQVTALIRRDTDRAALPGRVRAVVGDVLDPGSLSTALAGQDVVVSALGVRRGQPAGSVRSAGTATLVAAMTAAGVRRLVAVSSVGVGSSAAAQTRPARLLWPRLAGPDRLPEASRAEDSITASALDWTIIRAPRLVDGPVSGRLAVGETLRLPLRAQLRRSDLARALLDSAEDEGSIGRRTSAITRAGA